MKVIIIKENRKTLSIKLINSDTFEVKVPKNCNMDYVNEFILKSKDKLIKKHEKLNTLNSEFEEFKKGGVFLIFGEKSNILLKNKKEFISLSKNYLINRLNYYANLFGYTVNSIKIKDYKARWGCCDKFKNISLNYKLFMLDKELIDYVIIHELCHLKYLNHSKNFHNLLKFYIPNEKILKNKLKNKCYLSKI